MLHRLVGQRIASVATEGLELTLTFQNGATLQVFADLEPYEAGYIDGDGKFTVF